MYSEISQRANSRNPNAKAVIAAHQHCSFMSPTGKGHTFHVINFILTEQGFHYGLQWWSGVDAAALSGAGGGQDLLVIPDLELIVVGTGWNVFDGRPLDPSVLVRRSPRPLRLLPLRCRDARTVLTAVLICLSSRRESFLCEFIQSCLVE